MHRAGTRTPIGALVMAILAGCVGAPSSLEPAASTTKNLEASPTPGSTAVAIASVPPTRAPLPTEAPTQDPDPCARHPYTGPWTIDPLLPGSAVVVTIAELSLRAGPCAAAQRVEVLKQGDILILFGPYGPFEASGYPWYGVQKATVAPDGRLVPLPASPQSYSGDIVGGWIAANDGTQPFVTPVGPRCPTTVNLENVRGMLDAERLACFKQPIVLTGTFGCGGCGGAGGPQSDPIWLADTFEFDHLWVHWFQDEHPISIHFKPSGPAKPREGKIIRVTVHVDDPVAQKCTFSYGIDDPPFQEPPQIAIAWCRERFVVDSYEVLGTDPLYS